MVDAFVMYGGKLRKHLHQFDNTCAAFRNTQNTSKYRNALQTHKTQVDTETVVFCLFAARFCILSRFSKCCAC